MMIPAVVLAVVLVVPTLSLPLSTQESGITGFEGSQGIQGSTGFIPEPATTGEKAGIQTVSQIATGISEGSFIEPTGTRTGVEGVPTGVSQNVHKSEGSGYPQVEQTVQPVVGQVYPNTPAQVEKTGVSSQATPVGYTSQQYPENYPQNNAVPKVENIPVNVEQQQPSQTPLLLPIQPLTVVPVNQVGELLHPVVVPEEAITAGRVIIMAINPTQQRNFQDVTVAPEKQVPYQQVVQPVNPVQAQQTVQPLLVQPVQKEEPQTVGQTYIPVQIQPDQTPYVREQAVCNSNTVQSVVQPVQTYSSVQVAEPNPQVYEPQPNQVVNQYVEKQVPQQSGVYTPGQTQYVESIQQQSQNVQPTPERQGEYQQVSNYSPAQDQGVQTSYQQQHNQVEQQQQVYSAQQPTERQTPYQQSSDYIPVENQQNYVQTVQQQVYSAQPTEYQHGYNAEQSQPVQQQVYNVQPEYQQGGYTPVQSQGVEQIQNLHQTPERQTPFQQPIQTSQYIQPHQEEPTYQQQVSNVQPFAGTQVEGLVPSEAVQQESTGYVPQHQQKTSQVQPNEQVFGAEPQQVINYAAEPVYNFGDRIPQNPSVQQSSSAHVLSGVAPNQGQVVNPSVVSPQA